MAWSNRRLLEKTPDISEIYTLLYRLGLTANYTGFFHTSYAVYLAAQRPDRLLLVTKWLYPEVAKHYATTQKCVERNIRTAVHIVWDSNPELLATLARHPLSKKPKASKFLSILALYFSFEPAAQQKRSADIEIPMIQQLQDSRVKLFPSSLSRKAASRTVRSPAPEVSCKLIGCLPETRLPFQQ